MQTTRTHVTIDNHGQAISGFLHAPSDAAGQRRPAIALFHGFVGGKSQPHRLFVELAEALAARGMVALRIDFRGRGDSDGASVDMTPEGDIADARCALDLLAALPYVDTSQLFVLGLSWGGSVAACVAGRDPRVAGTVLWSSFPVTGHQWEPPMREIEGRLVAEVWGNLVGQQFYQQVRHVNSLGELQNTRGGVLIVYGTGDQELNPSDLEAAQTALAQAGIPLEVVAIADADHVFMMKYEWKAQVIQHTITWLSRQAGLAET